MRTSTLFPTLLSLALVPTFFGACDSGGDDAAADGGTDCSDTFFEDTDGDGYGNDSNSQQACDAPDGFVAQGGDCDDGNADAHPGGVEVCDGSDNDCD